MSISARIARFAAPWVRDLVAYKVEESAGFIKLDAMENPFPFPDSLQQEWLRIVGTIELNRYPDPLAKVLKEKLLATAGLGPPYGVMLGNGSDELIHMICQVFATQEGACVLSPEPSFAVYRIAAQAVGLKFHTVALTAGEFALDLEAMIAACGRLQPAVVFLASPNNPTANRLDVGTLEPLCAAAPGLVVLDEAYYRFAGHSRVRDLEKIENLVVMQTLSKIGLAGLRVGCLYGQQTWLELFERVRMPYNLNAVSQAGAAFALDHMSEFQRQIDAVIAERGRLVEGLRSIAGLTVWPSCTNFILLRTPAGRGSVTAAGLKARGILIKNLSGGHPSLEDTLRVTVGLREENDRLLAALAAEIRA